MRFTIISTKPGHQPPQSSCDFYAPGGTIGRGTDNNLVLPDNDRTISRLQAIVHVDANGECRVTNRGSVTRVVLNDIPLGRGVRLNCRMATFSVLMTTVSKWPNLSTTRSR